MRYIAYAFVLLFFRLFSQVRGECRYRNLDLPQEIFSYWASWGCYFYTRPDFFDGAPIKPATCSLFVRDVAYYVPGIQQDVFCHPFHYTNPLVLSEVDNSFWNNRSLTRWIECTKEAEDCCAHVMKDEKIIADHCPSVWDGWSCFRSLPSGQSYKLLCSRYAYGYEPPRCHHYSYKKCYTNATWNDQTDYSQCMVTAPLIARNTYYIVVLAISTIFCIPALIVLFFTKAAQAQKLRIVRALLLAICIHNVMVILVRALIILPELRSSTPTTTPMARNTAACRTLTFFEKLTGNCVFSCMLLIGVFLHQLLTNLFRIHDRAHSATMLPFYIGAGLIAVGSAGGWAANMFKYYDHNCWQVSDDGHVDWILDGPRLAMLCINFFLLMHICLRLWHAFNAKESDQSPLMRALKAALICVPVFGMQFLFLIVRPDMDNCGTEQFYYIISYTIAGAQGICIAIFHCYSERDVSKYFVELWGKVKAACRCSSDAARRSTVTETQHELVQNIPESRRMRNLKRPRSANLPDPQGETVDTHI